MLLPGATGELKIYQNAFTAEASPQISLRDTALHGAPYRRQRVFSWQLSGRGPERRGNGNGRGKKGNERGGKGWERSPHFFFHNLTTDCP